MRGKRLACQGTDKPVRTRVAHCSLAVIKILLQHCEAPMNEFNIDIALDEMPVSGWTCLSTCRADSVTGVGRILSYP